MVIPYVLVSMVFLSFIRFPKGEAGGMEAGAFRHKKRH